jgi:hypothetical protein
VKHGPDGVCLDEFHGLIGIERTQVRTRPSAHERHRSFVVDLLEVLVAAREGLLFGAAGDHFHVGEAQDVFGTTTLFHHLGAHVLHVVSGDRRVGTDHENALAVGARELGAARRSDIADLAGIRVNPLLAIGQHGVVGPAVLPQLVTEATEFVGHVVADVVVGKPAEAVGTARAFEIRGDDVPPDPAVGQVVQGGDLSGEGKRVRLQHGTREPEAQVSGDRRHRGNEQHRIPKTSYVPTTSARKMASNFPRSINFANSIQESRRL